MKHLICSFLVFVLVFYASQALALTSGTMTTGYVAPGGGTSTQTFTGTAGEGVRLTASAGYILKMRVYKPDGSLWIDASAGYTTTRAIGTLPATGTYSVVMSAANTPSGGNYDLYYVRGADSVSDGSLTSGQTYSDTLATNAIKSYQFSGTSGQRVILHTAASPDTYIDVLKPDGSYWNRTTERFVGTLPATGTYTVAIYSTNAGSSGAYKLYYLRGDDSISDTSITSGQTYNGTLAANAIRSYQFTGTSGEYVRFHTIASGYDMYIEIIKPDGSFWSRDSDRNYGVLPATGTYTVALYQASGTTATGAYKLYYVRTPASVSDGTLVSGSTRSATLQTNGIESYKFTGTASNSLSVTSTGSGFTRLIYVYRPNGTYWTNGSNSVSGTLPATGEYTLIMYGNNVSSTGAYTLTATTPPLSSGTTDPTKDGMYALQDLTCGDKMTGNPINFDVGYKKQTENDYNGGTLSFTRIYRSDSTWTNNTVGARWRHNFARTLTVAGSAASMTDGSGATTDYTLSGGDWIADDPDAETTLEDDGSGGYIYTLPNGTKEKYNSSEQLIRIEYLGGGALDLAYNGSGQLTSVTDESGRQLTLTYSSNRVATVVTPDGTYSYAYDGNGNLDTVTKPDTKTREYHYENGTYVNALTGITDEEGVRFATFGYNASGKANLSEHAGNVDSYSVTYNVDGTVTTTNPLGKNTTYYFTNILGVRKIVQVDGAASTHCVASNKYYNYDDKGRVISKTDWENKITRYIRDDRGLITQIIEAIGPAASQRITTITYNSTFNLPDVITETGKTTDYDYDAYGRMISMSVTDTNTSEVRTTTYSYDTNTTDGNGNLVLGRLSQIDGPRTDVTDTTDFTYDANFNLITITNALGQETEITARDAAGRPTTIEDENDVETDLAYDTNGWLESSTVAPGTALESETSYTYDDNGNLTLVTLPNGGTLQYTYDNAQRLTGIEDAAGNTITYTLDDAGNIIEEEIHDTTPTLKYTHDQVFDELSRIIESVGAATQTSEYAYDKNGLLTGFTDAKNNATAYAYDALNRLSTTTNALSGVTTLTYNMQDNITGEKDPRNNSTTYTVNAFGDITQEVSPDRGTTNYVVDKAGNITQRTDARSVVTNYTYDALNRLLTVAYPSDSSLNATLTYDLTSATCGTAGVGRLCTVSDASGLTSYEYDDLGRVTDVTELRSAVSYTTSYTYDLAGVLTGITLPSGRTITYTLNANKQVSAVSATVAGGPVTLASSITYLPFGPLSGLTYGNSLTLTAGYDTDYWPTSRAVSSIFTHTYDTDANGNITQKGTTTYDYDALNRLDEQNTGVLTTYAYDANNNRTSETVGGTPSTLTYAAGSNRITTSGYTYDNAGNITAVGTQTYVWSAAGLMGESKISGSTVGTYTYDSQNRRSKKVAGGNTTQYVYGKDGLLYGEYTNAGVLIREYVYLNGEPLAQVDAGTPEVLTYIHNDHLGTPRFGTNTGGTQVWTWASNAYGGGAPSGSATVNLRFPGQYYDAETGLHYNWNRYYSPATGRYVSVDPIGLDAGMNTFLYAEASPIMYADPEGLKADNCIDDVCKPVGSGIGGGGIGPSIAISTGVREAVKWMFPPRPVPVDIVEKSCPPGTNWNTADEGDSTKEEKIAEKPTKYGGKTPDDDPNNYDKKGPVRKNKKDGSIWEKDHSQHGGSKWKRWNNQKDWEKGRKPESVRPDGSVR